MVWLCGGGGRGEAEGDGRRRALQEPRGGWTQRLAGFHTGFFAGERGEEVCNIDIIILMLILLMFVVMLILLCQV